MIESYDALFDIDFHQVDLDGAQEIRIVTQGNGPGSSVTREDQIWVAAPAQLVAGKLEHDMDVDGTTYTCALLVRDVPGLSLEFEVLRNGVDVTPAAGLSERIIREDMDAEEPAYTRLRWTVVEFSLAAIGAQPGDEIAIGVTATNEAGRTFAAAPVLFQMVDTNPPPTDGDRVK